MIANGGMSAISEIPEFEPRLLPNLVKTEAELPLMTPGKKVPKLRLKSELKSETTGVSDEQLLDTVPIHELNYNIPMPYYSIDTEDLSDDEFRNDGTRYVQILKNKANMYRSLLVLALKVYDPDEGGISLPPIDQCRGVLFDSSSTSVMFDRSIPLVINGFNYYEAVCSTLDTYEGLIYIFTAKEVYQVSPEIFLDQYKGMFDSVEKKTNS